MDTLTEARRPRKALRVGEVLLKGWRCERCGHQWLSRGEDRGAPPVTCPNPRCRSPYWNKPKKAKAPKRKGAS